MKMDACVSVPNELQTACSADGSLSVWGVHSTLKAFRRKSIVALEALLDAGHTYSAEIREPWSMVRSSFGSLLRGSILRLF